MLEQAVKLEHHADLSPELAQRGGRGRHAAFERHTVHDDTSRVERLEPRRRAKHRRLAGSRWTHESDQLAARHLHAHAAEDRDPRTGCRAVPSCRDSWRRSASASSVPAPSAPRPATNPSTSRRSRSSSAAARGGTPAARGRASAPAARSARACARPRAVPVKWPEARLDKSRSRTRHSSGRARAARRRTPVGGPRRPGRNRARTTARGSASRGSIPRSSRARVARSGRRTRGPWRSGRRARRPDPSRGTTAGW